LDGTFWDDELAIGSWLNWDAEGDFKLDPLAMVQMEACHLQAFGVLSLVPCSTNLPGQTVTLTLVTDQVQGVTLLADGSERPLKAAFTPAVGHQTTQLARLGTQVNASFCAVSGSPQTTVEPVRSTTSLPWWVH